MIIILVLIAAVLIVAAIRDTQGDLFAALRNDVPAFGTWAGAIMLLGAIGFIPGARPVSRALIVLVFVVLFVNNYQAIIAGFGGASSGTDK